MLEAEFHQALQELHTKNLSPRYSSADLEKIRLQFAYLLQSYLWEGEALKTLNKKNYRALALAWHPDKLASDDHKSDFLSWYIKINQQDAGSLFKVLSFVKEEYRPELRYRAQDANNAHENNHEHFYFFSLFSTHLPLIYSIFWPLFYALESLERNLNNYSPERRFYAKLLYAASILFLPLSISIILREPKLGDLIIDLITYQAPWIGVILSNGITGLTFAIAAVSVGFNLARKLNYFKNIEFSPNLLNLIFYQIPLTPVFETWAAFKQNLRHSEPFKTKLLSLGKCVLASLAAVAEISLTVYGLYSALPLIGAFALFPVTGLVLANIPLMMSQIYHQPKTSFALFGEYAITIATHYLHLAKKSCQFVYNAVHAVLSPFSRLAALVKHLFSSAPKAAAQQSVSLALVATAPKSVPLASAAAAPYWKTKFDQYMMKDEEAISAKRRQLKKERNTILERMGVGEDHPFKEKLDESLNEKSARYDANGFVEEDASDKTFSTLEVLNLKTQVLFLGQALQNKTYLPHTQFADHFPKDLDYRKLVAKDRLG